MSPDLDAVVVGSGPNGLAAAITLAREGYSVRLYEAADTIGGGMRTAEITLAGFHHDLHSAIHPFGLASPIFSSLPLEEHGLRWVHPEVPLAHPFRDRPAALLHRSLEQTCAELEKAGPRYRRYFEPAIDLWPRAAADLLGPVLRLPSAPLAVTRIGLRALPPASWVGAWLGDERAAGLLAGLAGHSLLPMEALGSSAVAVVLGLLAHRVGWPMPAGGCQSLARALGRVFESLQGEIVLGELVTRLEQLPRSRVLLLDLGPEQVQRLLPHTRGLFRSFRRGPGIFKVDYALDGPVPWRDPACLKAGTVHLGGTLSEISRSEKAVWQGRAPQFPFLLVAQQSLFDPARAPEGKHTLWVYGHVPNGWDGDLTESITAQIESFAPGFRDLILKQVSCSPAAFEKQNPNYVGGDILGGANHLWQVVARPRLALDPYFLGGSNFICSASTPPGGGVHGMCGYHAARSAIRRVLGGGIPFRRS